MKSLITAFVLTLAITACTKHNPTADFAAGMENPETPGNQIETPTVDNSQPPEVTYSSGEAPRTGVAPEVLKADCEKKANELIFSTEQVEKICLNANEYSENCLTRAIAVGMLRDDVAKVCENAREGVVDCIARGRDSDKYSEEIAEACK